jgi:hypothetical protein
MTFKHVETGIFGGMRLTEADDKPAKAKQWHYGHPKRPK